MSKRTGKQNFGTSPSKQKLRLWLQLLRVTKNIETNLRTRLRQQLATTLPRADVIAALSRHPSGVSMSALTRQLLTSNGNVTSLIEKLAADGLVERVLLKADRRAIHVRLTAKGIVAFQALATAHETWIEEILSQLDADDVDTMLRLSAKADLSTSN